MTEGPVTAVTLDIPAAFIADPVLFIVMGRLCISFFFCCSNPLFEMDTRQPNSFENIQTPVSNVPADTGRLFSTAFDPWPRARRHRRLRAVAVTSLAPDAPRRLKKNKPYTFKS